MIIKVSIDSRVEIYDFPNGTGHDQNEYFERLIGNGCEMYELVYPKRLYENWGLNKAVMLVDESGALKISNQYNPIGGYLYGTDEHGIPIMGNILLVGLNQERIDLCDLDNDTFRRLLKNLSILVRIS